MDSTGPSYFPEPHHPERAAAVIPITQNRIRVLRRATRWPARRVVESRVPYLRLSSVLQCGEIADGDQRDCPRARGDFALVWFKQGSRMAKSTIGFIGAGHIGSQVARLATSRGYPVVMSNSRGPDTLSTLIGELGPSARAATVEEAARAGEIVVVSIPLKNYRKVPVAPLAGKIVIDTNNYYPQRDGQILELDNESTTTAELLQAHLPTSKVVKAFNHIYAVQLTTDGQPAGSMNRRALVIAGDDAAAKAVVTSLLDEFGFDTVDAGPLKEGWRIQRDTPGYGPRRTAEELRKDLAAARRYADQ